MVRSWIAIPVAIITGLLVWGIFFYRADRADTVNYKICVEIEKLKKAQRDEAIDNYNHLSINLALIGITVTPKIRDAAKAREQSVLRRFAPKEC